MNLELSLARKLYDTMVEFFFFKTTLVSISNEAEPEWQIDSITSI